MSAVPSRDLGVQVLARLRPWLALVAAITANSPIADGHDTGWASWRYTIHNTLADRGAARGVAGRGRLRHGSPSGLIGSRAALDERSVYFLARLSPRYPTVEVRVADVCLDAGDRRPRGGADPLLGRHRPGRGPPRDAGGNGAGPGRSPRPWPLRRVRGSPGPESTRSPGRPS